MKVNNLIYKSSKFLNDKIGLYSRKQCVRISTELGKDLVDFKNKGGEITLNILQNFLKKHVPKANVEIITTVKEYEQKLLDLGYTSEAIKKIKQGIAAQYFNFLGGYGIYIPELDKEYTPSNFAHEVEHFMFHEHFLPMKIMLKIRDKVLAPEPNEPKEIIDLAKYNDSNNNKKKNLETLLREYFGINKFTHINEESKTELKEKDFYNFLASSHYEGLTSKKRVEAYIRAIIRNVIHPTEKGAFIRLIGIKRIIAEESRAYKVSDSVTKYIKNNNSMTSSGFRSNIYKITTRLLKKEKFLALLNCFKNKPVRKTGLPTKAFVENKENN